MASTVHRWASQVAQGERIHLPMQMPQETWVQSLGREDPLEDEMETHFHILSLVLSPPNQACAVEKNAKQGLRYNIQVPGEGGGK